jgi:hypothetical protein
MLEGYVLALRAAVSSEPAAWRAGLGPPYVDPPSRQLRVTRLFSDEQRGESNFDHLIFVCLYRIAPGILDAVTIVQPETIIRWHRAGFRSFWRWKSRQRVGRPNVSLEVRRLIREMSLANPLWGAPRIHAELLKLGIDVGQTSVGKYMARRRRPPSQGWRTFSYSPEQKQLLRPREPHYCGNDMHEFLQSRGPATGI